jgi:hypothetical protein
VTGDEERVGYLAGEIGGPLDADEQADLDELRTLLANPAVWAEPDPQLEDRVVAMITSEPTAEVSHTSQPGGSRRRPMYRPIAASMLIAAVIAVVAAITVGVTSNNSRAPTAGITGNAPVTAQVTTALAPTAVEPGATGSATIAETSYGWRVQLHTSGLARMDNGRFYEAWLKNPAGILVPLGTFNQGPDVTLWSGVSPLEFTTLMVTEQMVNAGGVSSGMLVLVGTVETHN